MTFPAILADNITSLRQAISLIARLDAGTYTTPHPLFSGSTVGGHVRHNIDHYINFFQGLPTGRIDYENRERDPRAELDPAHASQILGRIAQQLESLANFDIDAPCSVRVNTDSDNADDPDHWSGSTVRRELQFLLGHAIHHDAQIAAICRACDICPPESFGMAPSTLRHRASATTA